jgi:Family of unknown function (DUF6328)
MRVHSRLVISERRMPFGDYSREESAAHKLDRNWVELVQELRVIGTGVQILFAFLLSIAFQARFAQTSQPQRDMYLATLLLSGLAAALLIAPVAMHRILFRIGVKDELVTLTNRLALFGLAILSIAMIGALVLVSDWVAGGMAATACGFAATFVFGAGWFAFPFWLRRRGLQGEESRKRQSTW